MSKRNPAPLLAGLAAFLAIALIAAAANAPYVFAEYAAHFTRHEIVDPGPVKIARGRMFDDYWSVETIGPDTYALGEPRFYQQNYSYLLVGKSRALMFDAGSGTRDILPVIRSLTSLPVTVIPSHLHSDHTGGIAPFKFVAMLDIPRLRAETRAGVFRPSRYEFLGMGDRKTAPDIPVAEWVRPGGFIDLGERRVQVLNTPGHTPNGVSVFDGARRMLFTGDYIYTTTLYAFAPGASLSAYRETAKTLLATLPHDTILWTAHCCRHGEDAAAPWLGMGDLSDLLAALDKRERGTLKGTGFYPVRYPVNNQMTLATGFGWTNP